MVNTALLLSYSQLYRDKSNYIINNSIATIVFYVNKDVRFVVLILLTYFKTKFQNFKISQKKIRKNDLLANKYKHIFIQIDIRTLFVQIKIKFEYKKVIHSFR